MDMNYIIEHIGKALVDLLEKKWECPIYAVVVATNGSILALQYHAGMYDEELDCEVLTKWYHPSGTFTPPINIMFTDSKGKAARLAIKGLDDKLEILN